MRHPTGSRRPFGSPLATVSLASVAALSLLVGPLAAACSRAPEPRHASGPGNEVVEAPVATFSIVARDPETGDLGVAVQSRFFAVGAVVPWARAGIGAIATQAWANTGYGPRGLDLLAGGAGAESVVAALTGQDDGSPQRQVGIVGADGSVATFTGDACLPWAGGRTGDGYAAQGNILAGPAVVDAMAAAFEASSGDLPARLLTALAAGQAAGGDARGSQSAALLVVRENGGYGGHDDRWVDLRVDDHPTPIAELQRLLDLRSGQLAAGRAQTLLRDGDPTAAVAAAEEAVRLTPSEGGAWMLLARARLANGERAAAAEAATTALIRDPWTKSAVLRGLMRVPELEELLRVERFARLWESIPAQR